MDLSFQAGDKDLDILYIILYSCLDLPVMSLSILPQLGLSNLAMLPPNEVAA